MDQMAIKPVILNGSAVRLEPLGPEHLEMLAEAGADPEIWRWYPFRSGPLVDMEEYVAKALAARDAGRELPFAILSGETGRAVGSTRFMNIDRANRRVEIGSTWIAPQWQRTALNTEAKYLLLRHAFEVWGCIRVELKTDALNEISRRAILRLGAREEGVLRRHLITGSGRFRDTVYYSIIDPEWPAVKAGLEEKMRSYE